MYKLLVLATLGLIYLIIQLFIVQLYIQSDMLN